MCEPQSKMAGLQSGSPQIERHVSTHKGFTVPDRARASRTGGEEAGTAPLTVMP